MPMSFMTSAHNWTGVLLAQPGFFRNRRTARAARGALSGEEVYVPAGASSTPFTSPFSHRPRKVLRGQPFSLEWMLSVNFLMAISQALPGEPVWGNILVASIAAFPNCPYLFILLFQLVVEERGRGYGRG